uniref:Carboxymuconolactone decarboxylase-like domain-containing protein n=1 Tax=Arion vulgaris TaxID=1028688 RepID=A0A0B7BPF8_9EUPU
MSLAHILLRYRLKGSYALLNLTRYASSDGKSKHERPISRFSIPDVSTVPSDMRAVMDEALEKGGFLPNIFKTLSHRPDEMRAFVNYHSVVMGDREGGHLTKADKEMIIVAVSSKNNCAYCIIAHSALCRIYSKNTVLADQIVANWETADIDDRQRAILTFSITLANCQPLSDQHFEALYKHGLDKEDAWDIGSVVALFSLSNRMAFLTGMIPNEEFYMLGRIPRPPKGPKL